MLPVPRRSASAMPSHVMPEHSDLQNARVSVLFDYPGKRAAWYDGRVQSAKSSSKAAPSQQQPIYLINFDNGDDEELKDLKAELSGGFLLFLCDDDNTGAWPPRPFGPTSPPTEPKPTAEHWPAGKGKAVAGKDSVAEVNKTIQKKKTGKMLTAAATKAAAAAAEARAVHKAMAAAYLPEQDWSHLQVRM